MLINNNDPISAFWAHHNNHTTFHDTGLQRSRLIYLKFRNTIQHNTIHQDLWNRTIMNTGNTPLITCMGDPGTWVKPCPTLYLRKVFWTCRAASQSSLCSGSDSASWVKSRSSLLWEALRSEVHSAGLWRPSFPRGPSISGCPPLCTGPRPEEEVRGLLNRNLGTVGKTITHKNPKRL